MQGDDSSLRQLVDELSSAALRDLLRNVRHHTELRRQIASGMLDERQVNQAYREYARHEGAAYRQQVSDITLQYYSDLADLGNQYSGQFYSNVLDGSAFGFPMESPNGNGASPRVDTTRGNGTSASPAAEAEEVPIELHGPPGREVMATFALENTETRPVALELDVGPCEGPGDESFMAPLTVHPARFVLEPGASRSITLRLVLLNSVFTPGLLYRLPVYVRGPGNMVLRITIWAEEPDAAVGVEPGAADAEAAPSVVSTGVTTDRSATEATPPPKRKRARASGTATSRATSVAEADERFLVRCPSCKRDFERSRRDSRLRPHNTPDGDACPERKGRVRTA